MNKEVSPTLPATFDLPHEHHPQADIVTAGQPTAAMLRKLLQHGVRSILNLRMPNEDGFFDATALAAEFDASCCNFAICAPADLTPANVRTFDRHVRELPHPILIHCGSSNRVGAMAALRAGWLQGESIENALAIGRAWGLAPQLEPRIIALLQTQADAEQASQ